MNTLHDVIYEIRQEKMRFSLDEVDISAIQNAFDDVLEKSENAICFDLGDIDGIREIDGEIPRLPYPVCWFEMDDTFEDTKQPLKRGCMIWESENNFIDAACFSKGKHSGNKWMFIGRITTIPGERISSEFKIRYMNGSLKLASQTSVGLALRGCSVMNCCNVTKIEKNPSAIAKQRARKKNVQLFSTWTLHIKNTRTEYPDKGGTHASPRVHLRRGHIRQYAPGKTTWVQPCIVRGKSAGIVNKDYAFDG